MPHGERDIIFHATCDQLTRIHDRHYPEQGKWKEYYQLVVDCLRTYLAEEFQIDLDDRSVEELRRGLRFAPLFTGHQANPAMPQLHQSVKKFSNGR